MLALLEGRNKMLVSTLWHTGARISEVLALTPSSIDFPEKTITLRTLKKKKLILPKKSKDIKNEIRGLEIALQRDRKSKLLAKKLENAKKRFAELEKHTPPPSYRTMPMTPDFTGELAAYCMENNFKSSDPLFPITRMWAHRVIQKAGRRAGIDKERSTPHAFRHGFAVNAVLSGVPPLVLRRWMGHAKLDTTLIYTEVLAQETRDYIEQMNF